MKPRLIRLFFCIKLLQLLYLIEFPLVAEDFSSGLESLLSSPMIIQGLIPI